MCWVCLAASIAVAQVTLRELQQPLACTFTHRASRPRLTVKAEARLVDHVTSSYERRDAFEKARDSRLGAPHDLMGLFESNE